MNLRDRLTDPSLRRFVRFVAVGLLNTGVGYALFALLVALGLGGQTALVLAFALGVLWNYQTHARLVFAVSGNRRLAAYCLVYLGLYGLNALALGGLMRMGVPPILAQGMILPVSAVLSYIAIGRVLTGPVTPAVPTRRDQA